MKMNLKMTAYVRPVTPRMRTPASPRERCASAQNSGGRASAPPHLATAEAPLRKSEVSRSPRKAVTPASRPPRTTWTSLGAVGAVVVVEAEREERRERSAWCGVEGEGEPVSGSRDEDECAGADVDVDVYIGVEGWRVMHRTAPASGTEQASSNRAAFPLLPSPLLLLLLRGQAACGRVSGVRSTAVR